MTRIIMSGCTGKMGRVITAAVKEKADCKIVAGIDLRVPEQSEYPVFSSPEEMQIEADVVIDFSNPTALPSLLRYAEKSGMPMVLCTTGYSELQVAEIKEMSQKVPIFYSGNMSLGINLLIELSKKAAQVFGNAFDVEIVEKHHNQKIDAPSGTALMIADSISSVMEESPKYVYDRHSFRHARTKNEIGIHSVRGGSIVGEHEVIFAGHDEILTISHSAQSKEKGAYPKLSGRHLTMAAFPKQNKIYILNNKKVVYILNARINLAAGQHQLLVGDLRGPLIFHYDTDGKDIKSINWLSVGQNADIEAEPKLGNHIDDTIQVSKKDAIWLYNNLPKDVQLRIY